MKRLLLLLTMIVLTVMVSSCGKTEAIELAKDDGKKDIPVVIGDSIPTTIIPIGNVIINDPNVRNYQVSLIDTSATYIVSLREGADKQGYSFRLGDTVNVNIYTKLISSKNEYTKRGIVTKHL